MKYQQFDSIEEGKDYEEATSPLPLILCVVCLLLILLGFLLFFFVGVPIMIQNNVNAAEFTILSVNMTNPDTETIGFAGLVNIAPNPAFSFGVHTATWYASFQGVTFGKIVVPGFDFSSSVSPNSYSFDSSLEVIDPFGFESMGIALMSQKKFEVEFSSTFECEWLGYTFGGIYFNKTVTLTGLHNFAGSKIDMDFTASTTTTMKVVSQFTFFNPSVFQIQTLGVLDFQYQSFEESSVIGTVSSADVNLELGNNRYTLTGVIQPADSNVTGRVLASYWSKDTLFMYLQGVKSSQPLFSAITAGLKFPVLLHNAPDFLLDFQFDDLEITPDKNDTAELTKAGFAAKFAQITGPSSIFSVRTVEMRNIYFYSPLGDQFGHVNKFAIVNVSSPDHNTRTWNYKKDSLHIDDSLEFSGFVSTVLRSNQSQLLLSGPMYIGVILPFGPTVLSGFKLKQQLLTVAGVAANLTTLTIRGDSNNKLKIQTTVAGKAASSYFSVDLGQVTFELSYKGRDFGLNVIDDFNIKDKTKTLSYSGAIVQAQFQPAVFGGLLDEILAGTQKTVEIQGSKSSFNHTWVNDVAQSLRYSLTLPNQKTTVIKSIQRTKEIMKFTTNINPTLTNTLSLTISLPFNFSYDIPRIKIISQLDSKTVPFAEYDIDFTQTTLAPKTLITMNTPDTTLTSGNTSLFTTVMTEVLTKTSAPVTLEGAASFVLKTVLGEVPLTDIKVSTPFNFGALAGFKPVPPTIPEFLFLSVTSDGKLNSQLSLNVTNPSNTTYSFGTLTFDASYSGQTLEKCPVNFNTYVPGANVLTGTMAIQSSTTDRTFITNIIAGNSPVLTLKGDTAGTVVPLIRTGFSQISLPVTVPAKGLIPQALIFVSYNDMVDGKALPVTLSLRNPHPLAVSLSGTLTLTFPAGGKNAGVVVGTIPVNLNVPAKTSTTASASLTVKTGTTFAFLSEMYGIPVVITYGGNMNLKIGTLTINPASFNAPVTTTFLANK